MIISTKPLNAAIISADARLDRLKTEGIQIVPIGEIGALYNLFLTLAEAVSELQKAHNEQYGDPPGL